MAEKYIPMEEVGMSSPAKRQHARPQGWRSRKRIIIMAIAAIILIIALAVGLGVGLTAGRHHHGGGNEDGGSIPSSPLPTPSGYLPSDSSVWQPKPNATWQIALQNPLELSESATSITPDVHVFDIDLFTNPNATFSKLHQLGKKVVCYFSAGSYEPDRPDSSQFLDSDKGKQLDGWPSEYWLNVSSPNVRKIMQARIELAAAKGCDAVDPDNMDGYNNNNGMDLTQQNSLDYMQFLSQHAAQNKLAIGLKNALEIVPNAINLVQFSVNEQCVEYSECDTLSPMIAANKAVFHIEYPKGTPDDVSTDTMNEICSGTGKSAGISGFSTAIKKMDLDGWIKYCGGTTATTLLNTS